MSPPRDLTKVRICWVVEKRSERPAGVSCVTERRGELCHVDGSEVSVLVRDLRSVFVMVQPVQFNVDRFSWLIKR